MTTARLSAAQAIHAVCENGQSLDDALLNCKPAKQSDETFFQALSYGGVRWYLTYQGVINSKLKKPFKPKDTILYAIMISAMYQIDHSRQAEHAVVNEAVNMAKALKREWAARVINAILRAFIREQSSRPKEASLEWLQTCFMPWMIADFKHAWPAELKQILMASQQKPPMTLRINLQKVSRERYLDTLHEVGINAHLCADSAVGITLEKPLPVHALPNFMDAHVSVQDESAQLATALLDLQAEQNVLDACAAPGGKSLHIMETMPGLKQLSVLDFPQRLPRLRENFKRARIDKNTQVCIFEGDINQAETWWNGELFDRILLDVPCTGTGVIRRHPDIKFRRQPKNGLQFAAQQFSLLLSAWQLLKAGGKLLYTTCSILPIENENNIAKFLSQTSEASALALPAKLGFQTPHGRQRLCGVHAGDGFFYALLEKQAKPAS